MMIQELYLDWKAECC